jgi:GMP synthase-like glutamine amidotransferase
MYETKADIEELTHVVASMGCRPYVLQGQWPADVVRAIRREKDIRHWIFSGGEYPVLDADSPQVPLEVLEDDRKTFLMICYSMESVLVQDGAPLRKRYINRKEYFHLHVPHPYADSPLFHGVRNPMLVRRNHRWYFPAGARLGKGVVASYNGEAMLVLRDNVVMTQYHPERSKDGRRFMHNWLLT